MISLRIWLDFFWMAIGLFLLCACATSPHASNADDASEWPASLTALDLLQLPLSGEQGAWERTIAVLFKLARSERRPGEQFGAEILDGTIVLKDGYKINSINDYTETRQLLIGLNNRPCLTPEAAAKAIGATKFEPDNGLMLYDKYSVARDDMVVQFDAAVDDANAKCVVSVAFIKN